MACSSLMPLYARRVDGAVPKVGVIQRTHPVHFAD